MAHLSREQLSLSWDAYQKNICNGLSLLQQRGEFVDMTLAADGHHVKVHQMVLSLVSPYIKELISSAQCPHPVIFLNNISYTTLCAILEYIYTGEVNVARDKLADLIAAGKALHIKGLREMDDQDTSQSEELITESDVITPRKKSIVEKLREHREKKKTLQSKQEPAPPLCKVFVDETDDTQEHITTMDIEEECTDTSKSYSNLNTSQTSNDSIVDKSGSLSDNTRKTILNPKLQYTVSNQGGLQVIYNRYIYHLRYFGKKNRIRLWRCIDYSNNLKCPANVCTDENNQVTTRSFTHNHPFHDTKILKKLRLGIIYAAFQEAESLADGKKKDRRVPCSSTADEKSDE